jgi:hypothetical protein
MFTN